MFDPSLQVRGRWRSLCLASACALALSMATASRATTLSDNLSAISEDAVTASSDHWLAASFKTDAAIDTSASITATLKASLLDGTQTLALYSSDDTGLIPALWLANFSATSSTTDSSSFSLSGVTLNSQTSYWLILSNVGGSSTWLWTADSSGTGAGFTGLWADSDSAGNEWFTNSERYPLQLSVSTTVTTSTVPEPASNVLMLISLCALSGARRIPLRYKKG
jgi:hypothetical protein